MVRAAAMILHPSMYVVVQAAYDTAAAANAKDASEAPAELAAAANVMVDKDAAGGGIFGIRKPLETLQHM